MKIFLSISAGFFTLIIISFFIYISYPLEIRTETEELQPDAQPIQIDNQEPFPKINSRFSKAEIYSLAEYSVTARVLSKTKYHKGIEGKIVPWDFALGWGKMSKMESLHNLKIKQYFRYYIYEWDNPINLTQQEIALNSANTHLIPATKNLLKVMNKIKKYDVIKINGKLVKFEFMKKRRKATWESSKVRTDTGGGACELIYVEEIIWKNKVYR